MRLRCRKGAWYKYYEKLHIPIGWQWKIKASSLSAPTSCADSRMFVYTTWKSLMKPANTAKKSSILVVMAFSPKNFTVFRYSSSISWCSVDTLCICCSASLTNDYILCLLKTIAIRLGVMHVLVIDSGYTHHFFKPISSKFICCFKFS